MAHSHIHAWESNTTLNLHGPLHELPSKEVTFLPNFDGEGNTTTLEHTRKYESLLCLHDIQYEYFVCRLFPLTFEGKVSNYYHTFFPLALFIIGMMSKYFSKCL